MIILGVAILAPRLGLMFWTILIFLVLLYLLRKFAWKPIINALKSREESIERALNEAKTAREEIEGLKAENERIIQQAKLERDAMLREARELRESIINAAKEDAQKESRLILVETRDMVNKEKEKAIQELKMEIGEMVLQTATKVIRQELKDLNVDKVIIEESLKEL
jgi:F-type H+-transporting ATPase subunit b